MPSCILCNHGFATLASCQYAANRMQQTECISP